MLAGTLSTDPAVACGRVDASQGDQGRFGYRTNAMVTGPDGSIYLTDEPCDLSTGAYAVRKIEPSGRVSTVASGMAPIQSSAMATSTLVNMRSQQAVANDIPNARLVAVSSNGTVYSASPAPIDMKSSWSTVYRRAANSQAFETVATHVRNLQALAVGPANELYLKSGYAIYRVDFN